MHPHELSRNFISKSNCCKILNQWAICVYTNLEMFIYISDWQSVTIVNRRLIRYGSKRFKDQKTTNSSNWLLWYFDSALAVFFTYCIYHSQVLLVSPCNRMPDSAIELACVCSWITGALGSYMITTGSLHNWSLRELEELSCGSSQWNGTSLPVSWINGAANFV